MLYDLLAFTPHGEEAIKWKLQFIVYVNSLGSKFLSFFYIDFASVFILSPLFFPLWVIALSPLWRWILSNRSKSYIIILFLAVSNLFIAIECILLPRLLALFQALSQYNIKYLTIHTLTWTHTIIFGSYVFFPFYYCRNFLPLANKKSQHYSNN